jgi:hypothetical protein
MSGVQIIRNKSVVKSCSNPEKIFKNKAYVKFDESNIYFPMDMDPKNPTFRINKIFKEDNTRKYCVISYKNNYLRMLYDKYWFIVKDNKLILKHSITKVKHEFSAYGNFNKIIDNFFIVINDGVINVFNKPTADNIHRVYLNCDLNTECNKAYNGLKEFYLLDTYTFDYNDEFFLKIEKNEDKNYPINFKCNEDGIIADGPSSLMAVSYGENPTCMTTHRKVN